MKTGQRVAGSTRKKQDVGTPLDFLAAVKERWGDLTWDLAATEANSVVPGRCFTPADDSLSQSWDRRALGDRLWLNPPFGKITPFVRKCAELKLSVQLPGLLLLLTPASVDSNWFRDFVMDRALVCFLAPRLKFVGETDPFPKPLMLSVFGEPPGFEYWRWKPTTTRMDRLRARLLKYIGRAKSKTRTLAGLASRCSDTYTINEVEHLLALLRTQGVVHCVSGDWYIVKGS